MLKLSKQADYATLLMSRLARDPAALACVNELADMTGVSAPMVSKTLKQLARAGLVESERGAAGGYRLSRSPKSISVAEIIAAIEGPIALTDCNSGHCNLRSHCGVRPHWQVINEVIDQSLSKLSLDALLHPAAPLIRHDKGITQHAY